jgi:hypothetical protein
MKSVARHKLLCKQCVFVAALFAVHCLCCKADTEIVQYSHNNPSSRLYLLKNTNENRGCDCILIGPLEQVTILSLCYSKQAGAASEML